MRAFLMARHLNARFGEAPILVNSIHVTVPRQSSGGNGEPRFNVPTVPATLATLRASRDRFAGPGGGNSLVQALRVVTLGRTPAHRAVGDGMTLPGRPGRFAGQRSKNLRLPWPALF